MSERLKCPVDSSTHAQVPLIFYIDFKSPYAYLAIEPTRKMLAQTGAIADWRPFVLDIPSYLGSAKLSKSGEVAEQNRSKEQWSGVKYAYFDCRRYANLKGLTVRGTVKIWDTSLPAIGMWWVKQQESLRQQCSANSLLEKYIDAIYGPFWRREFDAENLRAVEQVLREIGAKVEGFREYALGEGLKANADFQNSAFDSGVYGVPSYILPVPNNDSVGLEHGSIERDPLQFFGREHLPLIRWNLEGGQGVRPDVAYELDDQAQALANVAQTEGFTLPVYIDLKAPQSYLALDSTMAMAGDNNISLDWYFFAGQPLRKPAAALASEDRSGKHRRIRAQYIASEMQCYAPHQLKDLYAVERTDSATLALVWIKQTYAQDIVDAYVKAVLQRFWLHNEDVDSMSSIKALMTDLGLSLQGYDQFLLEVGPKALNQNLREVQDLAISVSPTYLIGTEPFQGRQHLPLLAARLGSKN